MWLANHGSTRKSSTIISNRVYFYPKKHELIHGIRYNIAKKRRDEYEETWQERKECRRPVRMQMRLCNDRNKVMMGGRHQLTDAESQVDLHKSQLRSVFSSAMRR